MDEHSHQRSLGWTLRRPRLVAGLLLAALLAGAGGCTRNFFRQCADREVNGVLAEKDKYPQWKIEQYHVYPDPRARFADPTNPDHPPMPPDDPAAYKLSPHSQHPPHHEGVARVEGDAYVEMMRRWDEDNRAKAAEEGKKTEGGVRIKNYVESEINIVSGIESSSPYALKPFLVNLDQAVELGVINAREYQDFREELYEAALPVTAARFSFAWQFAATEDAVRQWAGPLSAAGPQNNWNLGSTAGVSKLFSTGALLMFQFANQTVFNFASPSSTTSVSTINLNFAQPLLQGGGRAVALEPLTEAERSLLYAIRAYAHFRGQFYQALALGTALPGSLTSAAGIGGSIVGSPISLLATIGVASTDVAGNFRGYLPTLYRELDMAVDQKLVRDLERALILYEGLEEGGQVSRLQVDQVKSTLLNARNTVLVDTQNITNALDQLKLQLGVPTNIPLVLDDSPGRPITRQLDRFYQVAEEADTAFKLVEAKDTLTPKEFRAFLLKVFTTDPLVEGTTFRKKLPPSWAAWAHLTDAALTQRLRELTTERRTLLDLKTDLEMKGKALPDKDIRRLSEADFESDVGGLEETLRRYESRSWEKLTREALRAQVRLGAFRVAARTAQIVLVWARNERREQLHPRWPELPKAPLDDLDLLTIDAEQAQLVAVQSALANRFDLMNARAEVVDAWRRLTVTANALQGVFTVQYQMNTSTPNFGTHAFAFSSAATNQELILNAQLPLVRLTQRNAYRVALINYQAARRALMALEDNIAADVRFDVRQLHLFAENYKIQQKVLESLYSQVESSLEAIIAPPEPPAPGAPAKLDPVAAAALTSQYLGALSSLNSSQTKMYDIWLSYRATRNQLYLDVERMSLDARGVWIDESATGPDLSRTPPGAAAGGEPGDRRAAPSENLPAPRLLPPPQAAPLE